MQYFPRTDVNQTTKTLVGWLIQSKNNRFDAMFSNNHTFAMFRANINCLIRKPWSPIKKILLFMDYTGEMRLTMG